MRLHDQRTNLEIVVMRLVVTTQSIIANLKLFCCVCIQASDLKEIRHKQDVSIK
jgi:hypothetical protein